MELEAVEEVNKNVEFRWKKLKLTVGDNVVLKVEWCCQKSLGILTRFQVLWRLAGASNAAASGVAIPAGAAISPASTAPTFTT